MGKTGNDYPRWIAGFLGVPWREYETGVLPTLDGADCWGLVRLMQAHRGVDLPDGGRNYHYALREFLHRDLRWSEIPPQEAALGDVVVFRYELHVGFVLEPGVMVHVDEGLTSEVTRFDGPAWGNRLVGIWRYHS